MANYDTIIIGSGAGGLAAAVALAQSGQQVLVCEQHEVAGGWMHSFTLDGFRFNTGVHYIGELGPGERLRNIYEGLNVAQDLAFMELNPDGFDHLLIGDERFDIPKGKQKYIDRLKQRFPDEVNNIDRFFSVTEDMFWVLQKMIDENWIQIFKRPKALPWFIRSGTALINHYIKDPTLQTILKAQAGDHGMPPNLVSAAIHAAIIHHYIEGGYHPLGGGMAIARAFVRALKRAGGEIRLSTPVEKILIKDKKAVGIKLDSGEILTASNIISNADPYQTFVKLIGRENLNIRLKSKLKRTHYSTSSLSLYLAVDYDLEAMGIDSGNYWIYTHQDIDKIYENCLTDFAAYELPEFLFVTFTTLKDPSKVKQELHQIEVFTFVDQSAFLKWKDQPSGKRNERYQKLKDEISERMLTVLDLTFPGIKDAVVMQNLGTPLTNQYYLNAYKGNIYGIDKGVWQAGPLGFRPDTEFKNLYLCGASTMAHGIAYSTISGLTAAARVIGCSPKDFLKLSGSKLEIYQCEDPATWPERLKNHLSKFQSPHSMISS
ncbi:MAG: NAD(P)/FAD-dependent oxidoreductase [Anaerolineales bacterium]